MQIIIDIPEEIVEWINDNSDFIRIFNSEKTSILVDAIKNGTPNKWIPISERLPKEYKKVIVSDVFGVYIGQFVDAEENWGGKHFINENGMHSKSVTAWMPLPEPYKAESEDEE